MILANSKVSGLDIFQSGPKGQQTSIFTRGSESNHTLVLLNGISINDFSTPTGAFDFGQDFMFNVTQIEVYKGSDYGESLNLFLNQFFFNKYQIMQLFM